MKINNVDAILSATIVGIGVGQVSQDDKDTLAAAITTARGVYNDRTNKSLLELVAATLELDNALTTFQEKIIKAGNPSALTTAINDATTLHENAVEGIAVGEYLVGSKVTLKAAIDTAQLVLENVTNKTTQQLAYTKDVLDQAIGVFEDSKVKALTGLENVTLTGTAIDSSNYITLENGESLLLISGNESVAVVTENPTGTIKVTGMATEGSTIITVQVKRDGKVTKTGTFIVTIMAPMSITSKTITKFDFSTIYAGQVTGHSKPMYTSNFQTQPKSFTINDGKGNIIPVNLTWNIPQNEYVKTPAASIGSAVESAIQDYFSAHGGLSNRTLSAAGNWIGSNQGDTFRIQSFQTGSTQSITLGGQDWTYFFDQQTFYGTDEDSSQNRTFTISDGTRNSVILLTWNFGDMTGLVNLINQKLDAAQVNIVAEKVSETNFKLISTEPNGTITIDGIDKSQFFN